MDVPGYKILSELGQGGMATVYLAVQESLHRKVALKLMRPALVTEDDFRQRFLREGRIIARLVHPGIVTVFDFGSRGEDLFLSMEYLPGGTLKQAIRRGMDLERMVDIICRVADALAHAHRNGIIHRDVKPQNILFRSDGSPVLTDFGIARIAMSNTQLTQLGSSVGSPRYMSPEQVKGQALDFRSDLYSLGIVFYEVLTGRTPWVETEHPIAIALKQCTEPVPRLPPDLRRFQPLLEKLLAKDPGGRYENCEGFARELRDLARGDGTAPPVDEQTVVMPPRAGEPVEKSQQPGRIWPPKGTAVTALAVLLLLVGLGLGALYRLDHRGGEEDEGEMESKEEVSVEQQRQVARHYEALAREHLAGGDFENSLDAIDAGLQAAGNDAPLRALREEVVSQHAAKREAEQATRRLEQERRARIDELVAKVEERRAVDAIDEALSLVATALASSPGHERLLALREELRQQAAHREVSDLLRRARERIQAGALGEGLELVRRGLALSPDNADLIALQRQARQQRDMEVEIEALLAQCREHFLAQRLTTGAGGSAFDCYQAVLELQPGHETALEGIRSIAGKYATWASAALSRNDPSAARTYLTRLETVDPQDERLGSMRERLVRAEQRAREAAEAPRPTAQRNRKATAAPPRARGSLRGRCYDLLLKAQLGEALSAANRRYLEQECR